MSLSRCEQELQLQLLRLGAVTSAAVTRLGTVTVEASPCLRLSMPPPDQLQLNY